MPFLTPNQQRQSTEGEQEYSQSAMLTFLYAVDVVHVDVPPANVRRHHIIAGDLRRPDLPERTTSAVLVHIAHRHYTHIQNSGQSNSRKVASPRARRIVQWHSLGIANVRPPSNGVNSKENVQMLKMLPVKHTAHWHCKVSLK